MDSSTVAASPTLGGSLHKSKSKKARSSNAAAVLDSPTAPTSFSKKKRKHTEQDEPVVSVAAVVVDAAVEAVVSAAAVRQHSDEAEDSLASAQTKAEKGREKKRRKDHAKALENPPAFSFDTRGFKGGRMIAVKDVRDFVLHLLSDEKAQQWLYVANKRNIRRVVTVMIPGISAETLGIAPPSLSANMPLTLTIPAPTEANGSASTSKLPIFQQLFSHACPTKAPGEKNRMHSCYQAFTNTPLTSGEKSRRDKARAEKGQTEKTNDPTAYLLSSELMNEQAYPLPSPLPTVLPTSGASADFFLWKRADGWIEAPYQKASGNRKVLALDCEMCLTEDGSELTRVSVVDSKGVRIYDSLVKPDKPIRDYLTRYSGMTAEKLENVTTRLADVQLELAKLIDYNTILLGHSLDCDLRVLKLIHSWVIDTSVIYQHPRGPPFKASLKWLAQKWLNKEIQSTAAGGEFAGGHDSEEDARTCVELLMLKMQKGPGFGEFVNDQETIFERMSRGPEPKSSAVVDHGTPGQWHGAKAQTTIACQTDVQVLQGLLKSVEDHDFTIGRFMELSHTLGWSQPTSAALGINSAVLPGVPSLVSDSTTAASEPADLDSVHASLNDQIATLHAALPPLTALIIFTGHGDPQAMARLSAKKAKFDRLWKTIKQSEIEPDDRWMESDDRNLTDEVERCRYGLSFYCMK